MAYALTQIHHGLKTIAESSDHLGRPPRLRFFAEWTEREDHEHSLGVQLRSKPMLPMIRREVLTKSSLDPLNHQKVGPDVWVHSLFVRSETEDDQAGRCGAVNAERLRDKPGGEEAQPSIEGARLLEGQWPMSEGPPVGESRPRGLGEACSRDRDDQPEDDEADRPLTAKPCRHVTRNRMSWRRTPGSRSLRYEAPASVGKESHSPVWDEMPYTPPSRNTPGIHAQGAGADVDMIDTNTLSPSPYSHRSPHSLRSFPPQALTAPPSVRDIPRRLHPHQKLEVP